MSRPTVTTNRRGPALAAALVLTFALGACATDRTRALPATPAASAVPTATSPAPTPAATVPERNAADVAFAQQMIDHHRGAVDMAETATKRARSPQVRALGEQIKAAQAPEIAIMTGWLETWGEDVPADSGDSAHGGHGASAPGMLTAEQMAQLERAQGAAFDRLFLDRMIEHHRGAVEMAREEQAEGAYPAAVALARTIEADQTAEIERMRQLLSR